MKQYHILVDDQAFDVQILDDPRKNEVHVKVNGEDMVVKVEMGASAPAVTTSTASAPQTVIPSQAAVPAAQPSAVESTGASYVLKSPLPGVVVSIAAKPGQTVVFNQELLVIEAMKAMNVIRAPKAGTIGTINVTEGRKIAYGAPLLTIE
jgi:biotin carboxyl carrier protein